MSYPRTATALREILESHGLRPRKRHGQNFLTDPQAVDAIVRDAAVTAADRVIEVGTGVGLLTYALAVTGAEVVSFEVDGAMLALTQTLTAWPERVAFVEGDVLEGKHRLAASFREALAVRPPAPGRLLLVSNLPYGAGTPIVLDVLGLERPPDDLVVMLQREVVDKLLARVGDRTYGAPSVLVALAARGEVLRRFGPEVFWPRPRVRSSVVRLTPRPDARPQGEAHHAFGTLVTALFSRRRKILATALRHARPELGPDAARDQLAQAGLDPASRVETASPEALLRLFEALG